MEEKKNVLSEADLIAFLDEHMGGGGGAEPYVQFSEVPRIIAVCVRFKQRRKVHRIDSEFFHMRNPRFHLLNS